MAEIKLALSLGGDVNIPALDVVLKEPLVLNVKLAEADLARLLTSSTVSLSDATLLKLAELLKAPSTISLSDETILKLAEALKAAVPPPPPTPEPEPTPEPTPEPEPAPEPEPTPPPPPPIVSSLQKPAFEGPSLDSRIIHVSSSAGNDSNDGSLNAPKKTLAAAYNSLRHGFPDRMLLKKGDVWVEAFPTWKKGGRSLNEPLVIANYGTGPRPVLKTGGSSALVCHSSSLTPEKVNHVIVSGIHFHAHTRDPSDHQYSGSTSSPNGVRWLRATEGLTIDDCYFDSYHNALNIQDYEDKGVRNVTIRGCVIVDSYSDNAGGGGHSNGMYVSKVDGLLIEDCVFDHNGWNPQAPGSSADIYQHNLYIQYNNKNVTVRRNIFMRASSHGVQLRPGGLLEDNFFFRNPIALLIGSDQNTVNPGQVEGTIRGNVILEGNDIRTDLPRGWGIYVEPNDVKAALVKDNIVSTVIVKGGNTMSILNVPRAIYENSFAYKWPTRWGSAGTGSAQFDKTGPFLDPDRSLGGYKGLTAEQAMLRIREQSRDFFDPDFAALNLIKYIKEGFKPV